MYYIVWIAYTPDYVAMVKVGRRYQLIGGLCLYSSPSQKQLIPMGTEEL